MTAPHIHRTFTSAKKELIVISQRYSKSPKKSVIICMLFRLAEKSAIMPQIKIIPPLHT